MPHGMLAIAMLAAVTSTAAAPPPPLDHCLSGPSLDVEIEAMKDRTGRVIVELYPANEADFLKDKDLLLKDGKLFRRFVAPVAPNGTTKLCVSAPAPGAYAMVVIHDRDGRDKFSIRSDGVALPQAQSLGTSRPRVKQARIVFGSSPRPVRVHMQYLRGLRGFVLAGT